MSHRSFDEASLRWLDGTEIAGRQSSIAAQNLDGARPRVSVRCRRFP
jgi:hypothetical protein